jgi:hypothetical protein
MQVCPIRRTGGLVESGPRALCWKENDRVDGASVRRGTDEGVWSFTILR